MKKILRTATLSLLLVSLFYISGCWDSKEVEDLAISTILGWDKITEDDMDKYQVSARILKVTKPKGSESQPSSPSNDILIKGSGRTIQEAFVDLTKRLPSTIFYQHNTVLVLGERAAKEDLPSLIGNAFRFPGARPSELILVTQGEAFNALQSKPELASLFSEEVRRISEDVALQNGTSYSLTSLELIKDLARTDLDLAIPRLQVYHKQEGEETVAKSPTLEGVGVFRDYKLVGWLNQEETLGYLLITQKTKNAQISIPTKYDDTLFSYWLTGFQNAIKSEFVEGKPKYKIKIKIEGAIHEINAPTLEPDLLPKLEKATAEQISKVALSTISRAKELNADFLGLTRELHRFHPDAWEEIASDWRSSFQEAEIEIEVEAKIRNFGTATRKFDLQ